MNICCVIVTYNRKKLLVESIEAILSQNYRVNDILIIDNNSTDGTKEYLKQKNILNQIQYIKLDENIGGAGGFCAGIKKAIELGYDLFWVMDDDTIPSEDSLKNLIKAYENLDRKVGFLSSNVLWKDGTPCVMNLQKTKQIFNGKLEQGLIEVETATFVSLLITKEAVLECGLPIREFFIWADDTEFTKRISQKFKNYLVIDSNVIHKMNSNVGANIVIDDNRLDRYFYAFRNRMYIAKKSERKFLVKHMLGLINTFIEIILKSKTKKMKKISLVLKGSIIGIFFNPKIEFMK